ncbi:hypothetical protein [Winogradskyella sediminis]|uniref:hypothetical protein n=1 Tax=Winogradskyella sediminis TaxID=1382466 RepID=UPI000E276F2A|nr:hypothetical protein [Winogradskyella sediminis]REG84111.1 hypothetical protein C8N41_10712 [Winogradskyella sediminis]
MHIENLRKESSERSDSLNWCKDELNTNTPYNLDSIEGCNQNTDNIVTHLLERARYDNSVSAISLNDLLTSIIALEGTKELQRKINFASLFNIPLSYVLYCDETEITHLVSITSLTSISYVKKYDTYKEFADWIAEIKGWKSNKTFREIADLPHFDKQLRKHKTPWPTNLDCFVSDSNDNPIGLIEFQNADRVGVSNHCNNDFLLCKQSYTNGYGYKAYHDDIRRWTSQEIIRVQSGLRYFIITWSTRNEDYILKEVELVSIPHFPKKDNGAMDWDYVNKYKATMNKYANTKDNKYILLIGAKGHSMQFIKNNNTITSNFIPPPLSVVNKTFPSIYYSYKNLTIGNKTNLPIEFSNLI